MAGLGTTCSGASSHAVEVALAATAHCVVLVQSVVSQNNILFHRVIYRPSENEAR